ncbi:hypothetical protein ANO14919_090950 [Xylariales sp. No.14919]|nr:hypothetical protein ANO14919_090950 [Xylariales sp. No.14919]
MSSTSESSVYNGQVSGKPEHYYTSHPPTTHSTDQQNLQAYRILSYKEDSHRPVMASSLSAEQIQRAHQDRVRQQIDDFTSQFYKR